MTVDQVVFRKGLAAAKEKLDIMKLSEEQRQSYERYLEDRHHRASLMEFSIKRAERAEEELKEARQREQEAQQLEQQERRQKDEAQQHEREERRQKEEALAEVERLRKLVDDRQNSD